MSFCAAPVRRLCLVRARGLLVLTIAFLLFPLLIVWTVLELHRGETGATARARLWAPVGWLYRHGGFWPALAGLAALGLACAGLFALQLRRLRAGPKKFLRR